MNKRHYQTDFDIKLARCPLVFSKWVTNMNPFIYRAALIKQLSWTFAAYLIFLARCQIEMYWPALWPGLWGMSELWDTFAPTSDPIVKYARAGLCWQSWALLLLDEPEPLSWRGRNVSLHLSDGCHQHLDSTLSRILWWTRRRRLTFHHIASF